MQKQQLNSKGFGLIAVVIIIAVLVVLGGAGAYVYHRDHKQKVPTSARTSTSTSNGKTSTSTTSKTDPYAGWKTYCDATTSSCVRYPAAWISVDGFPGAFENSSNTAYISLAAGTNKDRAQDTAYIYSVDSLTTTGGPLDIVGYVVNNKPQYSVYNASYVATNDVKAGVTMQIVDGNYAFDAKSGTISLVATPGATGYTAITSTEQAKAWFTTPEAQADLLAMKSFYYQ